MLRAVIVDDEMPAQEALSQLLDLYHPEITVCACCSTVKSAVAAIEAHAPQVVFLDVELRSEKGFDLFTHFPSPSFKVIFITAYQQYAIQAFRFAALDYLPKPVNSALLAEALKKASDTIDREQISLKIDSFLHNMGGLSKAGKKIILKTAETVHLVSINDIMYCEADRGYTNFYLADKSRIIVSSSIGDYEDLLMDQGFFRIHHSHLLNLSYFKRYEKADGGRAILKNDTVLPVATRKKDLLLKKIAQL